MIDPSLEQNEPVAATPPSPVLVPEPSSSVNPEDGTVPEIDAQAQQVVLAQAIYACWRCGQTYLAAFHCPFCRAIAPPASLHRRASAQVEADSSRVIRMLWFLAAFLATSILMAIVSSVHDAASNKLDDDQSWEIGLTAVVELFDTVLVLAALCAIQLPRATPVSRDRRVWAWLGFVPAMGLCLLLNHGYFYLLRELIQVPEDWNLHDIDWPLGWSLVLVVVQPAIVEELFFRRLLLGTLKTVMGIHPAVWITAAAFGLAHLYNPLGVPYLIVLGALLGYARVASGSLLLSIVLHALHNLAVILETSSLEGF